jgi:hypothetical protein
MLKSRFSATDALYALRYAVLRGFGGGRRQSGPALIREAVVHSLCSPLDTPDSACKTDSLKEG